MRIALVTGASSGIGQSAAIHLARRGTGVILTYGANKTGAQDTVTAIEAAGGTAVALPLDLGDSGSFADFRESVTAALRERWGRDSFDVLVNNAGIAESALFAETSEELFDRLNRVLFKGPYFLTQTLLPLLADNGAIVNIGSNSALNSGMEPGYSAYASFKGALTVLSRYLAKELSPRGIRVNSISPGATRTRLADNAFERFPEVIPLVAAKTALGRVGEPDDIGMMIAVLASEEGRWVTGQEIEIAGGYNL
ncbi:SDR family NAD(P)-dependent oxidoreductase [Crossiella cryophila]|uniref:NAD(P)-dependent dehydrogenase (Short-subunit alcohol dehydrogenase family) n=1 Tax=Crossiella cryophila TaxID=43355 RepID=A0A7W7FV38_9PSEU|nr:SDR family oxidoreductase [Crossiella cryophila]MBB4678877.1 NAD(P)-dependent dehydrogenase (short-subunit alcohol dehydrogenase family) [Crossiella cryophila]